MEIVKLNVKGYYFYCPDLQIENYEKHLNKKKLLNDCAICKRYIMEPSYESVTNNTNIIAETEITIGKCGHMFHSECINSWLKTNNICPIDKVSWQTFRVADTVTKLILKSNENTGVIKNKFEKHKFYHKKYNKMVEPIKAMKKNANNYPGEINKTEIEDNIDNSIPNYDLTIQNPSVLSAEEIWEPDTNILSAEEMWAPDTNSSWGDDSIPLWKSSQGIIFSNQLGNDNEQLKEDNEIEDDLPPLDYEGDTTMEYVD